LKPYYTKVLEMAQGDTALAKKIIQSDYDMGLRETKSEHELKQREQAITNPAEKEKFWTEMNKRGIAGGEGPTSASGGLVGTELGRLKESQSIRKEAIDRALQQKELRLSEGKDLGFETEEAKLKRETLATGQEHETQARGLAESAFGRKQSIESMELAKKQMAESTRMSDLQKQLIEKQLQNY